MTGRKVYAAIAAITGELARTGIEKSRTNEDDGYRFRGIEDVLNALSPLLAKHKLCILPRVLDRAMVERRTTSGDLVSSVALRVAFDLVSAVDASTHTVELWGEALDASDKATSKALTACYKHAALQLFCVPTGATPDADARSIKPSSHVAALPPVQGWEGWVSDVTDLIESCETDEAITRVQQRYRGELLLLSKAEPWLYRRVGALVLERKRQLARSGVDDSDLPGGAVEIADQIPRPPCARGRNNDATAPTTSK